MATFEQTMPRPAALSIGDAVALGCTLVVGISFLFLPWLTISGQATTGWNLLSNAAPALQSYIGGLIFAAVKAYGGNYFKLPIIGNMADKFANK